MADSDGFPQRDDRHHRRSRSRCPVSPEWTGETTAEREEQRLTEAAVLVGLLPPAQEPEPAEVTAPAAQAASPAAPPREGAPDAREAETAAPASHAAAPTADPGTPPTRGVAPAQEPGESPRAAAAAEGSREGSPGVATAAPASRATASAGHAAAPSTPRKRGKDPARATGASPAPAAAAAVGRESAKYRAHANPTHTHTSPPKPFPPKPFPLTFAMVSDAAWPGSNQWHWSTAPATGPVGRLGRPSASDPWCVGSFLSLGRPTCVQCPGPLGFCSPVCPRGLLCCVCGDLGHLAPVHRCARSVCCVACAVSWATWLPFTSAPAGCAVLRVRCPGPLGSRSPVRPLGVLLCVCGVVGHLAPVHRCTRSVCCVACAVSWASWLLFTSVPAGCVVLRERCSGPLGSCSPVCSLGVLCWVCGVLGHLAPVLRCARSVCCVACAVSWATWLLFSGAPDGCVVVCAESWAT